MKKLTVYGADNQLHEITLTTSDIARMQTKESKRTMAIGAISTICSLTSIIVPKPYKWALLGTGAALAAISVGSAVDMANKVGSQENLGRINTVLREVCAREGFDYCI